MMACILVAVLLRRRGADARPAPRLVLQFSSDLVPTRARYLEAGVIAEFGLDGCPMLFELVGKKPRTKPGGFTSQQVDDD